jgi:hypothetical protein
MWEMISEGLYVWFLQHNVVLMWQWYSMRKFPLQSFTVSYNMYLDSSEPKFFAIKITFKIISQQFKNVNKLRTVVPDD